MASKKNKTEQVEQKTTGKETPEKNTASPAVEKDDTKKTTEAEPQTTYSLTQAEMDQVKAHIDDLQKKLNDMIALLQRNQADFENYRKRNQSVRTDSYEEGKRDCITAILPVLDDFDRVIESDSKADGWAEGVKLVHRKMVEILKKEGLTEIEADGAFDPNLHNAVMTESVEGTDSGMVVGVLQKGYSVKDKIVRHSMVKVSE